MIDEQVKTTDCVALGPTDIQISPLGIGTWAWGDSMFWQYRKGQSDGDLQAAYEAACDAGINFFDTAEIYGRGQSERLLGQFVKAGIRPVIVASKFAPWPWRLRKANLRDALRASLDRLGMDHVDLYQIHWPTPPVMPETWLDAMADAVDAGLVRAVGVSNYSAALMRRAYAALARRGVPLASNQVEYSLLVRAPERNGVLQTCRDLGVTLIAYSPLAMGMLTDKYGPEHPPAGLRGRKYGRGYLAGIQPLLASMRQIGEAHGKTPAQIALNWLIVKGAIPIPGAKNAQQAQDNAGALGWRLTPEETAILDRESAHTGARTSAPPKGV
jgi:aryl-alcohol dehydrogenase-like predicted oxidoreductase